MLSLFFLLFLAPCLSAQVEVQIREETRAMSQGSFNALVMDLPNSKRKDVESSWQNFMKKGFKGGKTKYDRRAAELFSDDVLIKEMSENTVDVYARVIDQTNGTQIAVWFNLGGVYLSSTQAPERYPSADRLLRDFAQSVADELLEDELKVQEKLRKALEKDLKSLEKDQKSEVKDRRKQEDFIAKAEKEIEKIDETIRLNEEQQAGKRRDIEEQQKMINELEERIKQAKRRRR